MAKFPLKLAKDSLQDTIYYISTGSHFKGFDASKTKLQLSTYLEIDPGLSYAVYGNVLAVELANKHKEFNFVKGLLKEYKIGQRITAGGKFELYSK
jgi:hypothetical protein